MNLDKNVRIAVVSYIGLFIIWGGLEIGIVPFMIKWFNEATIDFIKEVVLKIIIWFIPAVFLCKYYHSFLSIQTKLFSVKTVWAKLLPIIFLFTAFHLVSTYIKNGNVFISSSFQVTDILRAISVGIGEEMVFRGWLLNVLLHDKKWMTIIVNAVLFLLIHFPVWIRHGMLSTYITNGTFLQIMILSVIFSCAFIKSKSMLAPIMLHAYWNFLCFLL